MKRRDNTPGLIKLMQWLFPKLERWFPFLADRMFRLVFYIPVKYRVPDKEEDAAKQAGKFFLDVNGKKIQGYSWGEDACPYVLVVHGWAGRATQFRKFIHPMNKAGFRVLGLDGPAHGRSEGIKTSIVEFEQMLNFAFQKLGEPAGVITHSFGGAAVLYATSRGLPVKKLINIAAPGIADEILKTYLRAINGTWSSAQRFKEFVKKETGKTFEEFTVLHTIQHLPHPIDFLMIQDEDDADVIYRHAVEIKKVYPSAQLISTKGLGHTRVLKDDAVIKACVDFIEG